jgi:hypothetical protein
MVLEAVLRTLFSCHKKGVVARCNLASPLPLKFFIQVKYATCGPYASSFSHYHLFGAGVTSDEDAANLISNVFLTASDEDSTTSGAALDLAAAA